MLTPLLRLGLDPVKPPAPPAPPPPRWAALGVVTAEFGVPGLEADGDMDRREARVSGGVARGVVAVEVDSDERAAAATAVAASPSAQPLCSSTALTALTAASAAAAAMDPPPAPPVSVSRATMLGMGDSMALAESPIL